ncbi:MAG: CopD family protein [Variovorax sp.]
MTGADALQRWLLADAVAVHLGLAVMIGALASSLWVRAAESAWACDVRLRSTACLRVAVVGTLAMSLLGLWLQTAVMAEVPLFEIGPAAISLVRNTHYGHAWLAGVVALVVAGTGAWSTDLSAGPSVGLPLAALGMAAFAYSRSVVSHAGVHGGMSVAVWVDWLHLVLVCLWVGIVFIAAFLVLTRPIPSADARRDAAAWVSALSKAASLALCAIVLSGLFNIWRGPVAVERLAGSVYGNALLVKLALVACAVALGGFNRLRVMPSLLAGWRAASRCSTRQQHVFVRVLRIEAVVLAAVLAAAAVLSSVDPAA